MKVGCTTDAARCVKSEFQRKHRFVQQLTLFQKEVDKATAVIAVTGDNGEVSYSENKTTYSDYIKK